MTHRGLLTVALLAATCLAQERQVAPVQPDKLGRTVNVTRAGTLYLAGQPQPEDFREIAARGVKRVISLRSESETSWDEEKAAREAGVEFIRIPVGREVPDEAFQKVRDLLKKGQPPTLLHCASATRVGTVWLPYRVLDEGVDLEAAIKEAETVGLRSPGFLKQSLAYIRKNLEEKSVKPGINARYLAPDLKVDEWVARFEVESREVFVHRHAVVAACQVQAGVRVADVGSGTGLYTRLFADVVGDDGWVFAVDIVPAFLQHVLRTVESENVTTVLCTERSVRLPPESVDLAFICDTYHHFEYPRSTMTSLHKAIKSGGTLVVVDFERIPGVSREWTLGHVRAGKEIVRKEIEDVGFEFMEEVEVDGLQENYMLRFRRK